MERIELFRDGEVWASRYTGDDEATLIDLFGTNILPTAFDASVNAMTVYNRIRELNPDSEVTVNLDASYGESWADAEYAEG
jgi:hypothetical protein